jgi:streptogramin lyase
VRVLSSLQPGSILAGYRIEGVIARGGMGVVYRATQLALDRPVALKVIAPEVADDASFRERFQRESRLAASLDHPNVIPVHEAGESEGLLFITMRLVDGLDLGRLVARDGPLSGDRAARVLSQVAAALDAAHARGLVHRDVKPANVLVAGGDHVYLTDFGLVKNVDSASGVTQTGQVVGTVNYSAPEQIAAGSVDARTDVYALGCLAFFVLTGRVPFERETPVATMYAHTSDPPPTAGFSASVDAVLGRALAKSPEDRFVSAGDFARALTAALEGGSAGVPERSVAVGPAAPGGDDPTPATQGATAPTQGLTAPTAQYAEPATPVTVGGGGPAPAGGRPPWLLPFLAGLIVVTLVAVALFLVAGGGDSESHDPLAAKTLSVTPFQVGGEPRGIAVGEGGVWLSDYERDQVFEIDPDTGKRKGDPVRFGESPTSIAVGEGYVWVVASGDNLLQRIDPDDHEVSGAPIEFGIGGGDIAVGEGSVWVADSGNDAILRIDPEKNRVAATIEVPAGVGDDIAVGEGYLWVTGESFEPSLTRIDAKSGRVVGGGPVQISGSVAAGEGFGWGYDSSSSTVFKIDPKTQEERGKQVFEGGSGIVEVGAGAVWALDTSNGSLWRIDPRTAKALDTRTRIDTGSDASLAIGDDAAWVTQPGAGTVTKIGF